jgi:hypothetical protein
MAAKRRKLIGGIIVIVVGAASVVLLAAGTLLSVGHAPWELWTAGAAALGLLTGFATGLSQDAGSGKSFVTFVGAGILVPLLGGVGALFERTQAVTEKSTYAGTQIVEKTTTTMTSLSEGSYHPLAVMGSFFTVFAILAIVGIIGGILLRDGGDLELRTR